MFFPTGHENMRGRRWPVITIGLIALNVIVFLGTHWAIEEQAPKAAEARVHILMLAAMRPEVKMPPDVEKYVRSFAEHNPGLWKQMQEPNRDVEDVWDARMRLMEDPEQFQSEMDSLVQEYEQARESSVLERYAFIPDAPRPITYITANFLHGGWLHLIGNMWFLWLAGLVIEDAWGRVIFPVFYLLAGAAALQMHAWMYPGSMSAVLGASGAIAALMGAFLVRYPNVRIRMVWVLFLIFRVRLYRFKARAIWLLPIWLLVEILYGTLFGQTSGVAHWAHVGGFVFGALAALGLRYSGLEGRADQAIEAKVSWTADPRIVRATELMEQNQFDAAIASLAQLQVEEPDSLDAANVLAQVSWRKGDVAAHRAALLKLSQIHLKLHNPEAAWQHFQEFLNCGGERPPAPIWLEMCRYLENQDHPDLAVTQYELLASSYPNEKQSLLALLSAGRLCLRKLQRPADALRFYRSAQGSPITHSEWDSNIQAGINTAQSALGMSYSPAKPAEQ
jgi:membrane associated rhomboid family serine protease